jgi:hypothetical protein
MQLLKKFDQMAFSVDEYINALDQILAQKIKRFTHIIARYPTPRSLAQLTQLNIIVYFILFFILHGPHFCCAKIDIFIIASATFEPVSVCLEHI